MPEGTEETGESECFEEKQKEMMDEGDGKSIGDKPLKTKVSNRRFYTGLIFFTRGDDADCSGSEIGCKDTSSCMYAQ